MTQKKYLELISGSIITLNVALFYLEQLKSTRKPKHRLKNLLNNSIKELIREEEREYDVVEAEDKGGFMHKMSSESITFVEELQKHGSYLDHNKHKRYFMAYQKNPKAMEGIVDKVLRGTQ